LSTGLQLLLPELIDVNCPDVPKRVFGAESLDPFLGIDQGSPAPWCAIPPHLPG
jgi:hypothetical protein